jgi:aldose 1-epimerase
MSTERQQWGTLAGRDFSTFTIRNSAGASLVLSDFGATAIQMNMPSPSGELADVILGFDTLQAYSEKSPYFGATCGRFGNRIRRGRFVLDGQAYQVSCNDGSNSLHGGINGYDSRQWGAEFDSDRSTVTFSLVSPHGDEGFPGRLQLTSEYTLTDDNRVRNVLRATTDRATVCNLVHHSYFNLAGHASGTILDQELQIQADFYTPVDDEFIITGEVLKVAGTPFDFRAARPIGAHIQKVSIGSPDRDMCPGYDHNWCLRGEPGRLRSVLTARDPASQRGFELFTTEPGIHVYTAGDFNTLLIGKSGHAYPRFAGFTIETQRFPDGPNLSHVPQSRLDAGQEYCHILELRFFD